MLVTLIRLWPAWITLAADNRTSIPRGMREFQREELAGGVTSRRSLRSRHTRCRRLRNHSLVGRFRNPIHIGASRSRCAGYSSNAGSDGALEALRCGSASGTNTAAAVRAKGRRRDAPAFLPGRTTLSLAASTASARHGLTDDRRFARPHAHSRYGEQQWSERRGGFREAIHSAAPRERPSRNAFEEELARPRTLKRSCGSPP